MSVLPWTLKGEVYTPQDVDNHPTLEATISILLLAVVLSFAINPAWSWSMVKALFVLARCNWAGMFAKKGDNDEPGES